MHKPLVIWLIIMGCLAMAHAGDPAERRFNTHSANQVRTSFSNFGFIGTDNPASQFGMEWPRNSLHFYIGDLEFMFGAEVNLAGGTQFHSVEVGNSPRGDNEIDPGNPSGVWGWEPLSGYANPASEFVAMNDQPDTWPPERSGWLGNPNYTGIADQEGFYVVDDNTDEEFFRQYGFLPDSLNPTRKGMGWKVKVHSYQFNYFLWQNSLIVRYTLQNEGSAFYPNTFFATLVGTTVGGSGDTNDDFASYDVSRNLIYSWDGDNSGNTGWSPVGYLGIVLLETPGIDFDGIDNNGDGAAGSGEVIDAQVLAPVVYNVGDPIVLINYNTYTRTVSSMPDSGVTVRFNGRIFQMLPGDTLKEELNGFDDNLNGLIDKLTEIPDNGLDDNGNGLADEYNPRLGKKYVNYFTGNGEQNPLIDESKFDLVDNEGDWNPLTDDVGLDGIPGTNDPGENDGMPTSGAGSEFPGEPHIDKTGPDEADQVGLTSFFHFWPFNLVTLKDDEQLWAVSTPGYSENMLPNGGDGDIIFGSGYFPSAPGDSQRVAMGLVMASDLTNLRANVDLLQHAYNENFSNRDFSFAVNFPSPGQSISGMYVLNINVDNGNPAAETDLLISDDFGNNYDTLTQNLPNPASYNWQPSAHADGIFYKLQLIAKIDSFQTVLVSDSVFTINNPGNGTPHLMFREPIPSGYVSDSLTIYWLGGDPDGDPVNVKLLFSNNSGQDWQVVAENLPASGSYTWDIRTVPGTRYPPNYAVLKLRISDGVDSTETLMPGRFYIQQQSIELTNCLLVHRAGGSDGQIRLFKFTRTPSSGHVYRLTFSEGSNVKYYHIFDITDSV